MATSCLCVGLLRVDAEAAAADWALPALDERPIVQTELGRIQGSVLESRLGVPFYAFRGIRYAKSPVGERRFGVSEPVDAWAPDEVFNATEDGPMCVQYWTDYAVGTEDCLRLNVYTHNVSGMSEIATHSESVCLEPYATFQISLHVLCIS